MPEQENTTTNKKLDVFLSTIVDEKQLAQSLRQSAYLISLSFMRSNPNDNYMDPEWTENSFYFLNELAEVLDPVLTNEKI